MLALAKFLIPSFQRYFIWEPTSIINLWDSIYHFYPIGGILCWKTDIILNIHRRLGGYLIPNDKNKGTKKKEMSYILDGQQRVTSIFIPFYGGKGHIRHHENFDYTMYFDAENASFFFENELYKRKLNGNAAFLIRLKDVAELQADDIRHLASAPGFKPQTTDNIKQLRHALSNYTIPLICIKGFDIAGVCSIFERINQAGRRLETLDIMVARNFQNNPLIIEEQ